MRKCLFILFGSCLFTACHHHDDHPVDEQSERTVLVYMAAENNLNSFATSDLEEMKTGSKSLDKRQNLIVYVDQAETTPPYIARIKNGVLVDSVSMEESITADPAVMEKVLSYTRQNYPAASYGLVLWGHASGWLVSNDSIPYAASRAYGGDTGRNTSSSSGKYWMNIPSMSRAIARAMGDKALKFVFADCCNFSCVEVAYELRHVTDYVIGSPAEIPDKGAPYDIIVPDLFNSNELFYRTLTDHYYNYYLEEYKSNSNKYYNYIPGDLKGYSVPLSTFKTSELEELAQATATILHTIADRLDVLEQNPLDFEGMTYYGVYSNNRYAYDMRQMLLENSADKDFNVWKKAFEKAVPYAIFSARWMTNSSLLSANMEQFDIKASENGCVSMFFPRNTYRLTSPIWNTTIQSYQWNNVIRWQQYGW